MVSSAFTCKSGTRLPERFVKNLVKSFVREDQGQDLIEYALLAGFIALTSVAAITAVGTNLNILWGKVSDQVSSASSAS
jgi:pilus assembly protein Flp/PilA